MTTVSWKLLPLLAASLLLTAAAPPVDPRETLLNAMTEELERNQQQLKLKEALADLLSIKQPRQGVLTFQPLLQDLLCLSSYLIGLQTLSVLSVPHIVIPVRLNVPY